MTQLTTVQAPSAPPRSGSARGLIQWICTTNPFYVVSAGLFLWGLWLSFGEQVLAADPWAMMAGLAGYTLLLAVTALLLVRICRLWDDARTVLLLVVLMFLATSVTFDEVLVNAPDLGFLCYLGGFLFAVVVSEGLLRGIRLWLPAWFKMPYYLILGLFFLYPLALSPLLDQPRSEVLMWGLFGFSTVAGLAFLTLMPAIRRGPAYLRGNGSPWPWPLYPWVLFGVLGFAVLGRAFLLCWSMQVFYPGEGPLLIFGPYFLVPFGLAVALLLLEIGHMPCHRGVMGTALVMPVGLILLALVGHRPDPIYQEFLATFTSRLGGTPLYLTLLAVTAFYAYAALRRVPLATEALTATLVVLAVVGPDTLSFGQLVSPIAEPILAAAALQLGLGICRRSAFRCLTGAAGLIVVTDLALPTETGFSLAHAVMVFHQALLAVLVVGAAFHDRFSRFLRFLGADLVLLACLVSMVGPFHDLDTVPAWISGAYPLAMAVLLASYGLLLGHRPWLGSAALVVACWVALVGWRGYLSLRQVVQGLDKIALSLAVFALAMLISLSKSGVLARWLAAWGWQGTALNWWSGNQMRRSEKEEPPQLMVPNPQEADSAEWVQNVRPLH